MTSDNDRVLAKLSDAKRRNLMALSTTPGVWSTISEMRSNGATGSGMDLLHIAFWPPLCVRRWATWGSEPGQKRGEGYEYAITERGLEIRALIAFPPDPIDEHPQAGVG